MGIEEGCLVEGEIATGAGAICGVGSRFSRRGCGVNIDLDNMLSRPNSNKRNIALMIKRIELDA